MLLVLICGQCEGACGHVLNELTYDMFSVLLGSGSSSFGYGLPQPAILG